MKIFDSDEEKNLELSDVLKKIKHKINKNNVDGFIYFPFFISYDNGSKCKQNFSIQTILKELEELGAIELSIRSCDEMNTALEKAKKSKNTTTVSEGYLIRPIEPRFSQLCDEYKNKINGGEKEAKKVIAIADKYEITVKDREIRINNYLIGKPHATGVNFDFFEHIRLQKPCLKITRKDLSSQKNGQFIQEQVDGKGFIKILNGLGFKGEILKAFFYDRSKDSLTYRGDKITNETLNNAGINTSLFIKELEMANLKNNPGSPE